VAHPPGYPLYVVLGHLALQAPLGEAALRMNLMSALFGATACGGTAWLLQRWTGSVAAGLGGALSLAFLPTFWRVSTVAEVYTLHATLVVALWVAATVAGTSEAARTGTRAVIAAGIVLGLGLSHRPTILFALPATLALIWHTVPAGRRGPPRSANPFRWSAWSLGWALLPAVGIPLLFYGAMLLRSRMAPPANWGRPDDLGSLLSHVTTRGYGTYALGPAGWLRPEAWRQLLGLLWEGFGALALPLALLGCAAALLGRLGPPARRGAVAVALWIVPTTLFALSYGTEDVEVLFLPMLFGLALAVGLGIAAVEAALGGSARRAIWLLAAGAVCIPLVAHFPRADLRRVSAAADYGRDMLATVPRDGVLFVEGDNGFVLAYLQQVLGERTDVTVYDRRGLMFRDELAQTGSIRASGESALAYRVRREQEFLFRHLRDRPPTPVMFMTWPGYALPPGLRFEPVGLFYAVRLGELPLDLSLLWARYHESRVRDQALRLDDPFGLALAASYPLMRGERALYEGHRPAASAWFAQASRLAPHSESIHNYLGAIYGRNGEYARAVAELEIAVRVKPVSVRAWNNLARARWLAGDHRGARDAWRRSLALQPGQTEIEELGERAVD